MGKRRLSRIIALSALYEHDITGENSVDKLIADAISLRGEQVDNSLIGFARELVDIVLNNEKALDTIIVRNLDNWEFDRVIPIDRSILRLCVSELLFFPDIPSPSSIDEAIELAKEYGSQDSWRFVNGVLDGILKELTVKGKV